MNFIKVQTKILEEDTMRRFSYSDLPTFYKTVWDVTNHMAKQQKEKGTKSTNDHCF